MDLIAYLSVFYVIPFLILFAMVRWWLFALAAPIAFAISWWLWRDVQHADNPGAIFAIAFVLSICAGFLSGALARGTLLVLGRWRKSNVLTAAIGLFFFLGVPLGILAREKANTAAASKRRESPSLACRSRLFDARIAGQKLNVPLIAGLHVGEGREWEPTYMFELPEHARNFCTQAYRTPPELTNLSITTIAE